MEWYPVALFLVQSVTVFCDINHYIKYGRHQEKLLTLDKDMRGFQQRNAGRTKRFLAFNNDESNIRVEIDFSVPFLEIPLHPEKPHGSSGLGFPPLLSINAKSALVVTTLFFVSYLILPKLVQHFLPQVRERNRRRGSESFEIDHLLRGVEDAFHLNATACWQQGVCSLVRGSRDNTSTAALGKVLDGLSSMSWVESLTRGTALDEAFVSAKQNSLGCHVFHSRCDLESSNLTSFHKKLAKRYMNQLFNLDNSKTSP